MHLSFYLIQCPCQCLPEEKKINLHLRKERSFTKQANAQTEFQSPTKCNFVSNHQILSWHIDFDNFWSHYHTAYCTENSWQCSTCIPKQVKIIIQQNIKTTTSTHLQPFVALRLSLCRYYWYWSLWTCPSRSFHPCWLSPRMRTLCKQDHWRSFSATLWTARVCWKKCGLSYSIQLPHCYILLQFLAH